MAEVQRLKAKALCAPSVPQPSFSLHAVVSGTSLNSCTAFASFPVHSFSSKQTSEGGESPQEQGKQQNLSVPSFLADLVILSLVPSFLAASRFCPHILLL